MKNIIVIAKSTFREAIRDRILYGILGFSFVYVALTYLLSKVSLGDLVVLKSFGLAGIYIFGSIITIFLGASIINKEIEKRTLYFVFSKPVSRLDLILGKFIGLFLAVTATILIMTAVYLIVILMAGGGFDKLGMLAVLYQILETGIMVALLTFLSTISTPLIATLAAVMVLFGGHALSTVLKTAQGLGGLTYYFIQGIYYIIPNLEKFNLRNSVIHNLSVSGPSFIWTVIYAIAYSSLVLFLANFFLRRKEL